MGGGEGKSGMHELWDFGANGNGRIGISDHGREANGRNAGAVNR